MNRPIHPATWVRAVVFVCVIVGASLFETATDTVPVAQAGSLGFLPLDCGYQYVVCRWECANGATADVESMCNIKCAWDFAFCVVKEALNDLL